MKRTLKALNRMSEIRLWLIWRRHMTYS